MKAAGVFLLAATAGVVVAVLRSLLEPRPEEFEGFGRTADLIIVDDLNDGVPQSEDERARIYAWWQSTLKDPE